MSLPTSPFASFQEPSFYVGATPQEELSQVPVVLPTEMEPSNGKVDGLETSSVWGIEFASVTMDQTIDHIDQLIQDKRPCQIITANLNYVMLCEKHPRLIEVTRRAALTLCDGMPILWRSRLSSNPLPERVAGSDLIYRISERAAILGHRIYFLGAAEGVAQAAADRLRKRYPTLQVAGVECPPFRTLSDEEQEGICDRVRESKTDILLVAFGQPKGEFWIDDHLHQLGGAVCIQLGASFDFVAGNSKRAPVLLQKLGLEWLHRAFSDPKRLLPRYAQNAFFLLRRLREEVLNATRP